jgi:hypothetical protein
MTDFAGELGWLRKLSVQYRGMDRPGTPVVCKGKVVKKYIEGGKHLVDCEIWLENAQGEKTTPGRATVMLALTQRRLKRVAALKGALVKRLYEPGTVEAADLIEGRTSLIISARSVVIRVRQVQVMWKVKK